MQMLREIKEEQGREPGTRCLCNMKAMHWQQPLCYGLPVNSIPASVGPQFYCFYAVFFQSSCRDYDIIKHLPVSC
jgi:hypothetical protein